MTASNNLLPQIGSVTERQRFRQVLGQYPTGVCVITGMQDGQVPVAMVVGSFTSVSLDPPLIGFFPDRASSSWAKLRGCEHFCVNILSADQEPICRKLASKDPGKFSGVAHRKSTLGNPLLDGIVAWIECRRESIGDAGDHEVVFGRALELDVESAGLPLLFFQGGYGKFSPSAITALEGRGISLEQLRLVDKARPAMESIALSVTGRCIATVRVGSELAVVCSTGQARRASTATLVGQKLPFKPPTGSIFAAWFTGDEANQWLAQADPSRRDSVRAALSVVRQRGYSIGLLNEAQRAFSVQLDAVARGQGHAQDLEKLMDDLAYDPLDLTPDALAAIRLISVPVCDASGQVVLALTLHDFAKPRSGDGIKSYIAEVAEAAARITKSLGGRQPHAAPIPEFS
jgi:flavin reductase (DIM6/NTAB) family NADH-FMN oxidoreductase RutF